ncbi:MAG: reverse transcriptase domain-containing protein [Firmicutes bacterium]|nr:reverse transcriptase domain-containing protein [Bacillota bacterium]
MKFKQIGIDFEDNAKSEHLFLSFFNPETLIDLYKSKSSKKAKAGKDKVNKVAFERDLTVYVDTISRKVKNTTYKFTSFSEKLISKGKGKSPRVISLPTIRDKLTLSAMHAYLSKVYESQIIMPLPTTRIKEIIKRLSEYKYYIQIDIEAFYSSIDHEILKSKLKETLPMSAVNLIMLAIQTPTTVKNAKPCLVSNLIIKGVPEGLSISNILAEIYLLDFDKKFENEDSSFFYTRYVDDILILTKKASCANKILRCVKKQFKEIKLVPSKKKTSSQAITIKGNKNLNYLGYKLNGEKISVREESVRKLEASIAKMFSTYFTSKDKNLNLFEWRLNLKIAGAVYEKPGEKSRPYGWMFYFSYMEDIALLRQLDRLVKKLLKRFNTKFENELKSFFKAFHQINYNKSNSTYFLRFNRFENEEKRNMLIGLKLANEGLSDEEINNIFHEFIQKELKELEKDERFLS